MSFRLTVEEVDALTSDNLLLGHSKPGKRKVSGALLTPPSSVGSRSSSSSSTLSASISIKQPIAPTIADFDFPQQLDSPEAVEFLGFNPEVAKIIFDDWNQETIKSGLEPDPYVLLEFALGRAQNLNDLSDRPPLIAMRDIGITRHVAEAITDPRFTNIFESESLYFWVEDTIKVNLATLVRLQQRLKECAAQIVQVKKGKGKRSKVETNVAVSAAESSQPTPSQPTITMDTESDNRHLPEPHVAVIVKPTIHPNHVTLYKGKAPADIDPTEQLIQDDGTLNLISILSRSGGDFNLDRDAWYFTPEIGTAEQYRLFAATRNKTAETWIIQIQIPETFMNSLKVKSLWFGHDFKKFVWFNRLRKMKNYPAQFEELLDPAKTDIIRGYCSTGVDKKYSKMSPHEVQERFTEENLIWTAGRKAEQVCFTHRGVANALALQVTGKTHIEIHPPILSDPE
ncbi:hypothetical protein B0J11DRAFT_271760 [Dendryphion nanum]|uniref:Uncharacterized protein n=1 Tax=Dendryphion nanum TaxID=256645 RepID=A0A9P9E1V5_9PLEO|nr:hypothetical protein B0J11DRAFT_271760 [Dendryphion nanum]